MNFKWDEAKLIANLCKHGIDFIDIAVVFDGETLTLEDERYDLGKTREDG